MYGECGWLAIARPVVGKTGTGCLSEAKKGRAARAASANGTGGGRIKAHGMIIGRQVLASINQHGGGKDNQKSVWARGSGYGICIGVFFLARSSLRVLSPIATVSLTRKR